MSELVNNREKQMASIDPERLQLLRDIILRLHQGEDPRAVKELFRANFDTVDASEIIAMEQSLVDDGMDVMEIQKLCDIHADVFDGSIDEIHGIVGDYLKPGHPVHVMKDENRGIEDTLNDIQKAIEEDNRFALLSSLNILWDIDKHYSVKENCYFPLMEKYGFTAPPQVMWGVDDEIRDDLKSFKQGVEKGLIDVDAFNAVRKRIEDMIFKEEQILLPMILDVFTEDEWLQIAHDTKEIGYCIRVPEAKWVPNRRSFVDQYREDRALKSDNMHFKIGHLTMEELEGIMNHLPIDMTFIDKDDTVKYFNQAPDRVFVRSASVIGRTVQNCHPPRSVGTVESMLEDFKSGKSKSESFWIQMGEKFIHISYYAIFNDTNEYIGTLEVSHDVKQYRDLEGEKRLK